MRKKEADYYAYLLRLWREDGRANWRITLQSPHDGELIKFADLERFWEFLQQIVQSPPPE